MCADGKQSYRALPKRGEEVWDESAMNPKNKKKQSTGTEFLEDYLR